MPMRSSMIVPCKLSRLILIVLIEWSLHAHPEHWRNFQSVFLSFAVGQIEHLPWVQNGPTGFKKKPYVKSHVCAE